MTHAVLSAMAAIDAAIDDLADVDPMYMPVEERRTALLASARSRARLEAVELGLLAAGDLNLAQAKVIAERWMPFRRTSETTCWSRPKP